MARGEGLIRQYQYLKPVEISLLTQRRDTAPFGLDGGGSAAKGEYFRVYQDGRREILSGAISYMAQAGESLTIETPGGGGWGILKLPQPLHLDTRATSTGTVSQ